MAGATAPTGAGALAAGTVLLAVELCESLARHAGHGWPDARGAATQAAHLGRRMQAARGANLSAFTEARRQLETPADSATGRDAMLAAALRSSADTVLEITAVATDATTLAAEIAAHVAPDGRPDAVGAAEIAAGAAAAAAELVRVNLALGPDDPRRRRAEEYLAEAHDSVSRARAALLN